ncbi:putative bifunctional diguanylate cyclase/phosphodiesterase [Amphritea japonica]|nr:EAL domain-containing protein [Amphritea japonica]
MIQLPFTKRLENLPSQLKRLSMLFSLTIAILPPIGYWNIASKYKATQLAEHAEQAAHAVSKLVFINPDAWDLQFHHLGHIVEQYRPRTIETRIHVKDLNGEHLLLSESHSHYDWPISGSAEIKNNTLTVGHVTIESSQVPLLLKTLMVSALCLIVATGFLIFINRTSIRGINRASSEINRIHTELQQQRTYLDSILRSTENVAIIATDSDWNIQYYNDTTTRLLTPAASSLTGLPLFKLHADLWRNIQIVQMNKHAVSDNNTMSFIFTEVKQGHTHHLQVHLYEIAEGDSPPSGYTLLCSDITEQRDAAAMIERQATYDSLTDLPNRRLFLEQLERALASGYRHQYLGAVLFLDIDNFKNINDSLGHAIGDLLLQQVALRLQSGIRKEDIVARLGGDEFVVLLQEISSDENEAIKLTQLFAEKLGKTLAVPYVVRQHTLHITSSIGISVFPGSPSDQPGDIMRQADTAMYQAKDAGRNTLRLFLPSMQHVANERLKTLNDLRKGIEHSEFITFYQPQYDQNGCMVGAEALLRWQHPQKGLISPDNFIPLAEESGLIIELGAVVLETALSNLYSWIDSKQAPLSFQISVNISPLQFLQDSFVLKIKEALKNTSIAPSNLTLEITESVLLDNAKLAMEKIHALRDFGVQFSIDDFGTGYSSLAYLKQLSIDEVKIDRSFVRDILIDDSDAALVETVINLTSRLRLDSVAEGVETAAQFSFLKNLGCTRYQGYLFSKPLPLHEFKALLLSQKNLMSA